MRGIAAPAFVEVAVEAPATGDRTYTYAVPAALAGLEPGEAVVVEFGRRQALGVVLGPAPEPPVPAKPLLARVRSDGPLLPPLGLRLAAWLAEHYLAPPAVVLRAMLPPGLLERLTLVAAVPVDGLPTPAPDLPPDVLAALIEAAPAGVAVDRLARPARRGQPLAAPCARPRRRARSTSRGSCGRRRPARASVGPHVSRTRDWPRRARSRRAGRSRLRGSDRDRRRSSPSWTRIRPCRCRRPSWPRDMAAAPWPASHGAS